MKRNTWLAFCSFFLVVMFIITFWVNFNSFYEETGAGVLLFFIALAVIFIGIGIQYLRKKE